MGVGGGVAVLAVGAILAFGVDYELGWLDIAVVGWVLILAGATGLAVMSAFLNRRQRAIAVRERREFTDRTVRGPVERVVEKRRYDDPAPPV